MRSSPRAIGSLKRRGPALPGLRKSTPSPPLETRLVRVPGNHHLHAERRRIDAKLGEIMNHMDADRAQSEGFGFGQRLGPRPGIVVAADRKHAADRTQFIEDGAVADISRVDDVIGRLQERLRLGPQQAVSVGDQADTYFFLAAHALRALICNARRDRSRPRGECPRAPRNTESRLPL